MNVQKLASLFIMAFFFSACTQTPNVNTDLVPIQDVIFHYKNQLETAEDQILFKEFVKYKELGSTFDLYMLTQITLKATAQVHNSNEIGGGVNYSVNGPGAQAQDSLTISKTQGADITFSIVPLADNPPIYEKVKDVFKEFRRKDIYKLIHLKDPYNKNSQDNICRQLCVNVKGLPHPQNVSVWAYLTKNKLKCFRALKDRLVEAGIFQQNTSPHKASSPLRNRDKWAKNRCFISKNMELH